MALGKDLGALIGQIGADIRQWETAADKIQRDLKDIQRTGTASMQALAQGIDKAGRKMQQMGRTMTARLTAPLVALGGLAVREFGNFDAAMTQSLAIMGDVSKTMRDDMAKAAREIARTTSFSAQQAAESYFFLASAGLDAAQSLSALPQVAAFAQAGMFDMATATDLATDAQSALGLTVKDTQQNMKNMARVTDVLVKANTLANATVEQFSTALTREAGSALKTFNKDIEEGVAVLAAFADQGIKGERAGSGLGRVIRLLTKASTDNKEEMAELGLTVFDAEGKMRNLADIIEDLEKAFSNMSDEQRTAALDSIGFTARVQQMILPLIGTSNAIREYEKELRNAGGTTQDVAGKQLETFNEQLGLLWSNVRDVAIEFGQTMVPALEKLVKWSSNTVDAFREMDHEMRVRIIAIAGLFATGGPLLIALGVAARVIAGFISLIFSRFTIISAVLIGTIGTAQWFVDNWELLFERATKAVKDFFSLKIPQIKFSGIIGDEVQKASEALSGLFGGEAVGSGTGRSIENIMDTAHDAIAIMGGDIEWLGTRTKQTGAQFTTWGESFRNALGMMKDSVAELIGFDDGLAKFFSLFDEGGSGGDIETGVGIGKRSLLGLPEGMPDVLSQFGQMAEVAQKNLDDLTKSSVRFVEGGGDLKQSFQEIADEGIEMGNALQTVVSSAVTDFAETLGNAFTGDAGAKGFFNNILLIVTDFGKQLGRMLIAAGVAAKAFQALLANPYAAIAAGVALVAASTAAANLLKEGPSRKVNDALITNDGKVIEFNPRDNILAFQGAIPSAGDQIMENHLYIDGREIEIVQEERTYRNR